jgi:BASS family bile acid:Na+ symporter
MLPRLTNAFPLWVLLASVAALVRPGLFTWFSGSLITAGLAVIMLGMGLTLEPADLGRVVTRRWVVALGVVLQYTVMPSLGWSIAWLFDLPTPFAVGLILVACCPGGTASNVITYLARADVPLSITMTAASTVLAVVMTPALTALLASSRVDVPAAGLLLSTLQVVVAPIALGLLLKRGLPGLTHAILPFAPLAAVLMITLIVGSIFASGRDQILASGLRLAAAVFCLHAGGFLLGYLGAWAVSRDVVAARTITIEVGMQNSGLGIVLARQHFASPLVAMPSAISSLFHSLVASALVAVWRRNPRGGLRGDERRGPLDLGTAAGPSDPWTVGPSDR